MNRPLWKGARQLLLQPRTLQADLSCSGDTKGWYLDPSLGERRPPSPPSPPGGEQSADFHLSWPSPTRSRASCLVPSQHLCQHVASSAFGQTAMVAQASAASPVLGRWGDVVTCCLPSPPSTSGGNSKAPENISARIQTTCWLPEQGYPGSREDRSCIVPGPETCLSNSGWDS